MSKREKMKTSVKGIVDYWSKYVDECGLSVDWAEADHRCWRCGYEDNLQRCHIIPDALGGKDEPSNLVLLCERCHADGPNVEDPEIMWDWIRAYGVPFYDTFWIIMGRKEYKFIYGHSFEKELERIFECSNTEIDEKTRLDLVREKMSKTMERTGLHFG